MVSTLYPARDAAPSPAPDRSDEALRLRLVNRAQLADGIVGFTFESADGLQLPDYAPGSHIEVRLASGVKRQYSLVSRSNRSTYEIAVHLSPQTRGGSEAMHGSLAVGDEIEASFPRNLFALQKTKGKLLLLAGGIGITPILCMAEELSTSNAEFELHYAARGERRMAFAQRIRSSAYAARSKLYCGEGGEGAPLDLRSVISSQPGGTHLYVCGPLGFIDAALQAARELGWKEDQLHSERFGAAPVTKTEDDQSLDEFDVCIRSTGNVIHILRDRTIAESLIAAGVEVETSCEQGVCGTCLTRVLEGAPDHRDSYLTTEEREANDQMLICCSRSRTKSLLLDL